MALKTKVIIGIVVLILVAGTGAAAMYFFAGDKTKSDTPKVVAQEDEEEEGSGLVYPLTGLEAEDEEMVNARPLCVKIPNDGPARPQTNINLADVVYETLVEGGETRMNAIYQSMIPEDVGPVRSARLSDIWIVPQYKGMLFFSGANDQVRGEIEAHGISDMRWSYADSIYFRSNNGRDDLHNLHIRLNEAYSVAESRDYKASSDTPSMLHFEGVDYDDDGSSDTGSANSNSDDNDSDSPDSDTSDDDSNNSGSDNNTDSDSKLDSFDETTSGGSYLQVFISHIADIEFKWDSQKKRYLKWINGEEHKDAATDEQINVANVVVLWTEYIEQSKKDSAGSPTYDTVLGGSGKASVFKNGERYDCQWKADESTPPRFYDSEGEEVLLTPGNTWIIVPQKTADFTSE